MWVASCRECPLWDKTIESGDIGRCLVGFGGLDSGDRGPCGLDSPTLETDGEAFPPYELES